MERRVVAFAEQIGHIAGAVLGKAEGWMDRERLMKQIAGVRDGAVGLLEQLAGEATTVSTNKPVVRQAERKQKGRSGGAVDAPGKKRRKPVTTGAGASIAASQAAKMRAAKTMVKTRKHRGRG
ncbi:MAG: hypothetical protein AB7N65_19985 [Vicinamibacterales bacterium]